MTDDEMEIDIKEMAMISVVLADEIKRVMGIITKGPELEVEKLQLQITYQSMQNLKKRIDDEIASEENKSAALEARTTAGV